MQRADAVGERCRCSARSRRGARGAVGGSGRGCACVSPASIASIGDSGLPAPQASRATSAATSLMRSRNSAFSTRSEAQVVFGLALHRGDLALQPVALLGDCAQARPPVSAFVLERFRSPTCVRPSSFDDRGAQFGFDLAAPWSARCAACSISNSLSRQSSCAARRARAPVSCARRPSISASAGLRDQALLELGDAACRDSRPCRARRPVPGRGASARRARPRGGPPRP